MFLAPPVRGTTVRVFGLISIAACATSSSIDGLEARSPKGTLHPDPVFGGRIYLEEDGPKDAPLVVLLHGLGGSADDYDGLVAELDDRYRLLSLDLPGFARSSKVDTIYSPARYVAALEQLLTERAPFDLIGHSMGASIALLYAARYPHRVRRLVVIGAAGILHGSVIASGLASKASSPPNQDVLRSVTEGLLGRAELDPEGVLRSPLLRWLMLGSDPTRIAALGLAIENFGPAIDRVEAPALLIWGEDDRTAPLRTGRLLEAKLGAARLEILPGAGHAPMKSDPGRTAALVADFLAEQEVPAARGARLAPGVRKAVVDGASAAVLEGAYDTIEILRSSATLKNVAARSIRIVRSEVVIENARVLSEGTALEVHESKVEVTVADLRGAVAIESTSSRIDLAGVTLIGREAAVRVKERRGSSFVFSVSRARSPRTDRYLHGTMKLRSGETL